MESVVHAYIYLPVNSLKHFLHFVFFLSRISLHVFLSPSPVSNKTLPQLISYFLCLNSEMVLSCSLPSFFLSTDAFQIAHSLAGLKCFCLMAFGHTFRSGNFHWSNNFASCLGGKNEARENFSTGSCYVCTYASLVPRPFPHIN